MRRLFTPLAVGAAAWLLVACGGGSTGDAGDGANRATPTSSARMTRLALPDKVVSDRVDARLRSARGSVNVWVSLDQNSVAAQRAQLAEAAGLTDRKSAQAASALRSGVSAHRQRVRDTQAGLAAQLQSLGAKELARVQVAHNAIAVRVDAAQLKNIAALPGVSKVRPVVNYQLDLSETVPYVGASKVQTAGYDGSGVTVAVLDSGIDYTHRNLGGAGTQAAYEAAYGGGTGDPKNTTRDGLFPTAKVVDGYDFVGESWPNAPEAPDEDPIDFEGHGTHVSDIIAGQSTDGAHKGVAPGAKLVAVKVCSAVATSCSGVALLQGMDFALDPNGDGETDDAVDVINMSLGQSYGQVEDDLSLASANAVKLGVAVVTSAGNSGDRPYITGSPGTTPGVISVAQTQVPSAVAIPLVVNSPEAIAGVYANTATVEWAPVGGGVTGDVVYIGRGCPGDALLASPAGKIALIDRGACAVSLKVDVAADAGATGVLIGLVAGGDAVSFSFGGGDNFVPTLVIQQSLSNDIKGNLAAPVNVSFSPASAVPLIGSMASTSSRGPSYSWQTIKPEIGAPGASLSAEVGTGTGETAFGGTSGAAPMVAGAVALLRQAHPTRSPEQLKAMLMNTAETVVYTNPALLPGGLAPITRIGAGELRVDRALNQTVIAWNRETRSASLSFGAQEVAAPMIVEQTLRLENFSRHARTFKVTPSFRYANDQASGAIKVLVRPYVSVGPRDREDLEVRLLIDPTKLPDWALDGGGSGGDGALLNEHEFDGYLTLTSGSEKITVPWHVLPRKAGNLSADVESGRKGTSLKLRNWAFNAGEYDAFSLTGVSPRIPRSEIPGAGSNQAVIDLRSVGVRHLAADLTGLPFDLVEFAISTNGRRAHPNYPAEFDIPVDTNGDGVPEYVVYNAELGAFASSGQNVAWVQKLKPDGSNDGPADAFFFTDADLNSGSVIFTVPLNVGSGGIDLPAGGTLSFGVYVFDNYFSGLNTDAIENMRFTPGAPRFSLAGDPFGEVGAFRAASLPVSSAMVDASKSSELGLLLMYRRNADREAEAIRLR
ncbi:MAG: S8 family serine peptidase [Piscinibacter sp.]|uniref:S8 family peptidase n=1 Tax=Piscinibacter TaxID=1114981 RepID=UPI000FDE9AE8|nr:MULTISPECIES: S8 family serine peptidase [Piscinibacter]MCW5663921.1 S8 family serine peptidase [Piscinibacter sp.]